ncbi:hypothetical protein U472_04350 [Orenia metallireducens]|jgi:hypothetical protein|uniref:Outer membrane protein beta-barrel domain-containing protein n=1 Tax=Orenia metallireducens TaxID=1413210 RepID=A0A1C0ABR2_9FIRM|nr:hypothetical protein [Orenia metallireducens]OCL27788.1 hypothetical protein U472_04350 [Orenia metallireducens]
MRKFTILLALLIMCLSSTVVFAGYEVVGGGIYTTFDFSNLNDWIKNVNKDTFSASDLKSNKFDEIENTAGFYLGGYTDLPTFSPKLKIGGEYENISPDKSKLYKKENDGFEVDATINIDLQGFTGVAKYQVNKFIIINGGLGYYTGEYEFEVENSESYNYTQKADLSGIGAKLGIGSSYSLSENVNIYGNANYRILTLDMDFDDSVSVDEAYIDGNYNDQKDDGEDELDASGFELTFGLAYKF